MSVTPLTAPASYRLMPLETLKGFMGITGADAARDALLAEVLDNACSSIWAEWGRAPRTAYEETLEGGRSRVQLRFWPVDRDSITVTVAGSEVDAACYRLDLPATLYRRVGWPRGAGCAGERSEENVAVTYTAGYVLPDQVGDWQASTEYVAGQWVRVPGVPVLAECTRGGQSGAVEPTWPDRTEEVSDGSAAWAVRDAREVPSYAQGWARIAAGCAWNAISTGRDPALLSRSLDGAEESYSASILIDTTSLPPQVLKDIRNRRWEAW